MDRNSKEYKQCMKDIKMLNGLSPYNTPENIVYGDVYFYQSIIKKYGEGLINKVMEDLINDNIR